MKQIKSLFFLNKIDKIFDTLNFSTKRVMNLEVVLLVFTSIVNFVYLMVLFSKTPTNSFQFFLTSYPNTAVVVIVSIVNIFMAELIGINKAELIKDKKQFKVTFIFLAIVQFILGSVILFVISLVTFYSSKFLQKDTEYKISNFIRALLLLCALMYVLCCFLVMIG
ncbi:hypothetical protein C7H83_04505 [Tetragenococcus halophilus]|uniref:Uncharacterized protein n=1 Tax=Tetragenococcus halophilus TaxID=51669 RepID=A0A3G5FHI7_TETHA|nr:hypothetical protein [Tetragenococcus halophilus]AYW49792.1 hypothetical protein C7H83_04505 [Tetragenococcus halophilus]GBD63108.1 hypothetical protein TEHD23766T_0535 [Tetragenococcus halophilus subsp. flandriensis]